MTSPRHFFSETEKTCLLELIKKHDLHSGIIRSSLEKQLRWVQITEEYNCVESNSKRTENQLKKLWENLRTRGKAMLQQEKRALMRAAGAESNSPDDEQNSKDADNDMAKKVTPKQFFSDSEKLCLQQLLVKHHLHQKGIYGREKKFRWIRLTEEFNSIDTNFTRTTGQLKKCWENMRARQKIALSKVKQERMQTSEGSFSQEEAPGNQDTQAVFFLEQKPHFFKEEQTDSDRSGGDSDSAMKSSIDSDTETSEAQSQPAKSRRRTLGQQKDEKYMQAEFALRREKYMITSEREAEIHKLVLTEKELLVKTAEESYKKAKLEREAAEELLLFNRAKRMLAESQLSGGNETQAAADSRRRINEEGNEQVSESI